MTSFEPPFKEFDEFFFPGGIFHPGVLRLGDKFVAVAVDVGRRASIVLRHEAQHDRHLIAHAVARSAGYENISGIALELSGLAILRLRHGVTGLVLALRRVDAPIAERRNLLRLSGGF